MSGAGAGAQQNWIARLIGFVQPRHHFARMIGRNSSVVRPGHEQDRGVVRAVSNVMIGRVGIERLELFGVLDRAEFGNIERAVWSKLDAQHVVNPHRRHHRSDQIRVLRDHRSHQQAAI